MNEFESRLTVIRDRILHLERNSETYSFSVNAVYDDGKPSFEYATLYQGEDLLTSAVNQARESGAKKIEVRIYKTKTGKGQPEVRILLCKEDKPSGAPGEEDLKSIITGMLGKLEESQVENTKQLGAIQQLSMQEIQHKHHNALLALQHKLEIKELSEQIAQKEQEIEQLQKDLDEAEEDIKQFAARIEKARKLDDGISTGLAIAETALKQYPKLIEAADQLGLGSIARALTGPQPDAIPQPSPPMGVSAMQIDEQSIPQLEKIIRYFQGLNEEDKQRFSEIIQELESESGIHLAQLHQTIIKT